MRVQSKSSKFWISLQSLTKHISPLVKAESKIFTEATGIQSDPKHVPRGGFQMCGFKRRRYSNCQIFSDLSQNKSNLLKKQPSCLLNLTRELHTFCHSLSGFRSWTCPVFQISSSTTQLWKGKYNHHSNFPRSALLQTVQFGSKFLAVGKGLQSRGTAEQRNAEMWLREAGNPGEHQSKIFAFLCPRSLLLGSNGWK